MKVYFIGAGPGDPDLITVKPKRLIEKAEIIIHAGSLVNREILEWAKKDIPKHDSAGMNLAEVTDIYRSNRHKSGSIARLQSGDPAIYGAIQEQMDFCRNHDISFEVIPGVSSFSAAAAVLEQELTLPGISQTVILSRISGRTKTPKTEDLGSLAQHKTSFVIFLSIQRIEEVVEKLKTGYPAETPVAVVYRASWPDQKILRGTLMDIAEQVRNEGITRQALVFVGATLAAHADFSIYETSRLYNSHYSHGFRRAKVQLEKEEQ